MQRHNRILLFFLVLATVLLVGGALALGSITSTLTGQSTTTKYRVSCDGTIDVPAVDTAFTNPTIKTNSCQRTACNALGFSIFSDPFAQTGNIQLVINNEVVDSASWTSSFGTDQNYQLESSCITNPTSATVKVKDSTNTVTDDVTEEFT